MTFTKQDDGGFWISGPLVAVLAAALFGSFGVLWQTQTNRLWEDANDITSLKVSVANLGSEITRTEASVSSMNVTFTGILNSVQGSKDSVDALKEQVHDLQKEISDIDAVLRPKSINTGH